MYINKISTRGLLFNNFAITNISLCNTKNNYIENAANYENRGNKR